MRTRYTATMHAEHSTTKICYCTFCGRSSNEAGLMMEDTDKADTRNQVRICRECAAIAIEVLTAGTNAAQT